jgi:hypothetical protein
MGIRIGTKCEFLDNVLKILKTNLNLAGNFEIYNNVPALKESYKYGNRAD